ncbi:MAG: hypothetical protein SH859_03265 [Hyphomicrobium aestuarii]|nr:hypothetical protein [Hyphomicrobium aestuarii]
MAIAALVVGGGVMALDTDNVVASVFDRSFTRAVEPSRAVADIPPVSRPRLDGIVGSEAFWLGIANPEIARVVAVGQPLTLRSGGNTPDRRLVIIDVREVPASARPTAHLDTETRIDTRAVAAPVYLIVCRDHQDPTAAEFLLELRNGEISIIGSEAPRIL